MSNGYDVIMCWKCGTVLDFAPPVSRSQECPSCGAYVRCCLNCKFYEKGAPYDCRESIEEPVRDKESSCFCAWFSLNPSAGGIFSASPARLKAEHVSASQKAKAAFNSLFGD